jgi:lipopolysaccharide/colanic/teichoic acid biosynthesis glycosyltransferase
LRDKVIVHHAVEQQILKRYPGLFTEAEIHSLKNLRGIPKSANPDLHLSKIRRAWNDFYRTHARTTKQEVLDFAGHLDEQFGAFFEPPL